ncbi:MAG: ABC transporter ATP-binding protein [Deltaproteobacteria bacterium]|nr:ABC transporter ATP-binding protein [Deltaproteobacteria bacterium]
MTAAIHIENLSKQFILRPQNSRTLKETILRWSNRSANINKFTALSNINLTINKGKSVAIIGQNGSGKSTLFKIISGIIRPTAGDIMINGRIAPLIELNAGFHPELSGIENIFLNGAIYGMNTQEITAKLDAIKQFADIGDFIYSPVRVYSSGMMARLAFALAINIDADILLIDEVLAVGDISFQKRCIERILEQRRAGNTIVYVSHDLKSVKQIADRVVLLEHGVIRNAGEPNAIIAEYLESQGIKAAAEQ